MEDQFDLYNGSRFRLLSPRAPFSLGKLTVLGYVQFYLTQYFTSFQVKNVSENEYWMIRILEKKKKKRKTLLWKIILGLSLKW